MTVDGAVELFTKLCLITAKVAGPILLAALLVGLVVGVLQAATQVNEASVSFGAKLLAVGVAFAVLGSWTLRQLVDYTSRTISSIALTATRVSGLVVTAPLPWTVAPLRVRAGLTLALALAARPGAESPTLSDLPLVMAVTALGEFVVGAGIGFVVRLTVAAAEVAAEILAPQIGLGVAHLFDPNTQTSETALGSVFRHLAVLLAVAVGLHRVVLEALLHSFQVLPLGALIDFGPIAPRMLALTVEAVETGVRIALPTMAVIFMVQVALAFMSRAAPAMQIFSVGFAITLSAGALVLTLTLPDAAHLLASGMSHVESRLVALFEALSTP
jgi:flagellar biosynthetic protein FliR